MSARYIVTDRRALEIVGLPVYMLGTWDHYNTHLGHARLGRVSGRGQKFASLLVADFEKAIEVGLVVPVREGA